MGSEDQLRCLEIHIAVFDVLKSLLNAFICLHCLKILILFSSYWFYFFFHPDSFNLHVNPHCCFK